MREMRDAHSYLFELFCAPKCIAKAITELNALDESQSLCFTIPTHPPASRKDHVFATILGWDSSLISPAANVAIMRPSEKQDVISKGCDGPV